MLKLLRENGKLSTAEIMEVVGLSTTANWRRIQCMEQIKCTTALSLHWDKHLEPKLNYEWLSTGRSFKIKRIQIQRSIGKSLVRRI
ncbi:MAG: AsnC family protein [Pseudohongiellaceae bacterium]